MRVPPAPTQCITAILVACVACSDDSTMIQPPTRVSLKIRTQLTTDAGEPIRGVGFGVAVRPDGDTAWVDLSESWGLSGTSTVAYLRDSLGPAFHGTVRLSLRRGYPQHSCPAFLPDTFTVRYDQPLSVKDDTLVVVHTLATAPLAVLQPGELCATATGIGVQAWFIIDSIPPTTDSAFGRFMLGFYETTANYDGHFQGAVQDSVLILELRGDNPTYCPTGGIARLRVHPDGSLGVMAISPQGDIFLFVPNPGIPWF